MITITTDGTKEGTTITTDGDPLKGACKIEVATTRDSLVSAQTEFFQDLGPYGGVISTGKTITTKNAARTPQEMKNAQKKT